MKVVVKRRGKQEIYEDIVRIQELTQAPYGEKIYFFWRYKAKENDYIMARAEDVEEISSSSRGITER